MVIKSLVLYQYLKDVVAFDTTLLIRVRFTVRKRVWVYLCILCDQQSLSAACYHLGLPSSSSIKVFSYFYLHKQESIPSYNKLICTSIERKPNKTKKQQKTSNKNNLKQKNNPRKLSFLLSFIFGIYYRHSVLTLKYFYCSSFWQLMVLTTACSCSIFSHSPQLS